MKFYNLKRSFDVKEEEWDKVSSRLRAVFNLGIEQTEWLQSCRMARFIAAAPFLAGCDKALETSFSHLAVYFMSIDESSRDIYNHKPEDDEDLYLRLSCISNFKGGDQAIIECCMDLIALNMIPNYRKDAVEDAAIGKYNPVAAGKWDWDRISEKLIDNINDTVCSEISAFYTVDEAVKGYWQG